MADEVSPEIIQSTQKLLGKHVTKPQLTEKLLRKPPFRFLHDVIVVVVRNGFLKGLYTDAELNSDNVKDRDAKINFLNKLITAVKTLSGKDLQAKASKIIAGLDATETNRLLQTIAKLIDDKVETREYIKNLKKTSKDGKKPSETGESARDGTNAKKSTSKSSVTKTTEKVDSTQKKVEKKTSRKGSDDGTPKAKTPISKTKTDAQKTSSKPNKTAESKDSKSKVSKGSVPKTSPKEKVSPKVESTSSTPKTTTETSTNVEEPTAIESDDKTPPEVKEENKSVEVEKTPSPRDDSWKPQILKDSTAEVEDLPPSYSDTKELDAMSVVPAKTEETPEDIPPVRQPSARPKSARPRSGNLDQRAPSAQINKMEAKPEEQAQNVAKKPEMKPIMAVRDFSMKSAHKERENSSSKVKENMHQELEKEVEELKPAAPFRPKSSLLRPPSVRPSSARPAAPRLRPESSIPMREVIPLGKINVIVENCDAKDTPADEDEEETVVIQSMPDESAPENNFTEKSLNLDIPADKGHLVEQILEQIQDGGQGEKAQLEWEHEGSKGKDATTKEITALRASIQALTKTANPLGKLASYLHEDVEAMHSELETWLNTKQQYTAEIAKQRRVNNESNQPLLQQLRNLEEGIKHEREEIASIKYSILRNEERIRHMVTKQIAID